MAKNYMGNGEKPSTKLVRILTRNSCKSIKKPFKNLTDTLIKHNQCLNDTSSPWGGRKKELLNLYYYVVIRTLEWMDFFYIF